MSSFKIFRILTFTAIIAFVVGSSSESGDRERFDSAANREVVGRRIRRGKSPKSPMGMGMGHHHPKPKPKPKPKPCPKGMGMGMGMSADDCSHYYSNGGYNSGDYDGQYRATESTTVYVPPQQGTTDGGLAQIGESCEGTSFCVAGAVCVISGGVNPTGTCTTTTGGSAEPCDNGIICNSGLYCTGSPGVCVASSAPSMAPSTSTNPNQNTIQSSSTTTPTPWPGGPGSCAGGCGGPGDGGPCYCDDFCQANNDCCQDFGDFCTFSPTSPQNPAITAVTGTGATGTGNPNTAEPFVPSTCHLRVLTGTTSDISVLGPSCDIGETFLANESILSSASYTSQTCEMFTFEPAGVEKTQVYLTVMPVCKSDAADQDIWEVCSWQPNNDNVLCAALNLECCDPIATVLGSSDSSLSCQQYTELEGENCGYFYGIVNGVQTKFTLDFQGCEGTIPTSPNCAPLKSNPESVVKSTYLGPFELMGFGFLAIGVALALRRNRQTPTQRNEQIKHDYGGVQHRQSDQPTTPLITDCETTPPTINSALAPTVPFGNCPSTSISNSFRDDDPQNTRQSGEETLPLLRPESPRR